MTWHTDVNEQFGMNRVRSIHFVGIGGTGMSGIAEVLINLGYYVSGSDIKETATTRRLQELGVSLHIGHTPSNLEKADVVVKSSAISRDNVELKTARENRIPVIPRAEMLAELMRFRFGIAVAGTHGKTTTTSLIAWILGQAGLDPTFVIGGRLNSAGTNAQLGKGSYLVAEADESDASFLYLQPMIAVLTNIDRDHLDNYQSDFSCLQNAFVEFLHHVPFYGMAIVCTDDSEVNQVLPRISKPIKTYGTDDDTDFQAYDLETRGYQTAFKVKRSGHSEVLEIVLNMPGRHNMLNALAAIAVATELGVANKVIIDSLSNFKGIGRRLQVNAEIPFEGDTVLLVDDYGHHPREIRATIDAVKQAWPERRLLLIFQPHRFTRTRDLFEDFTQVLSEVSRLIILDVYTAGEEIIPGADSRTLCRAIRMRGQVDPVFVASDENLAEVVKGIIQPGDLILTMGAGSVGQTAHNLSIELNEHLRPVDVS